MVQFFGEAHARRLLNEPWVVALAAWQTLVNSFFAAGGPFGEDGADLQLAFQFIEEALFVTSRIIVRQDAQVRVRTTDAERLAQLYADGWQLREASGRGCNCFAFSLILLPMSRGVLRVDIADSEQDAACDALRQHLLDTPGLEPRDEDGTVRRFAYLQHHRHADACVRFILEHFRERQGRTWLPAAGIQLFVHTRWDVELGFEADRWKICEGMEGGPGAALELHMYNQTGSGVDLSLIHI